MLGLFLTIFGTIFEEIGTSAGKAAVKLKLENIYGSGFVTNLCCSILFIFLTAINWSNIGIENFWTLLLRIPLEISISYFTILAVIKSSRSTFGFIRTGTIPLLLLVDFTLGYALSAYQIGGICLISLGLWYLYLNHGFEKQGLKYVLLSTLLPVLSTSLAKYNFSHGNSWELEQALVFMGIALFFYLGLGKKKRNVFSLFKKPLVLLQAGTIAAGNVALVSGFNIMSPSVHTAAKRSTAVLAAVVTGGYVFHEKKLSVKVVGLAVCILGIILLSF